MDRQAWIAITLCIIGLVVWQVYVMRHPARPPMPAQASPSPSTVATSTPAAQASLPSPSPSSSPAETAPAFAEKKEVLRNSDVELRLTNRGGAISEVVLLNHIDDHNQRLILNSPDRMPIGAIVQKPEAASLSEFALSRAPDGSVQFQRDTPEHVSIRKKFFFPPTTQKKDNFLAQLDVNFRNDGAQPANYPDYYVTLGSARPVHANDLSTYTHLIWCTAGKTKSIDVNWFAPQSSFLGLKRSAGHDFYGERLAGAEWAAVTNQFFATLFAPLDGKVNAVWGRRFEIPRGEGLQPFAAVEGAMGMPGLTLQPGQNTTVRFEIYAGPKLYHRLAQLEHNEAEILRFRRVQNHLSGAAQPDESAASLSRQLRRRHSRPNDYREALSLAVAKQGQPLDAPHVRALAQNAGVAREI